jgi:hypothetical protein
MKNDSDPKFHCKKCNKDFKRAQDLKMHRSKVHSSKSNGKSEISVKPQITHIDIIAMLNVKINAMQEVKRMLENL